MPDLKLKFDRHGLGDVCHFSHALQLYKRRGYDITVQVEENKKFLWQIAGVHIVQGDNLPDHSYHYPSGFDDLSQPDHATNKVAFGLRHDVMPKVEDLGLTQEHAWDELCAVRLSAHDYIPSEAHAEAETFLEGLPRPIICFHSRGTNWHERKSLSTEVAFDVILKLIDQTGGSVVVLDYDRRAPMVGDARCKGIKPSWGHIGIDRLCALYERCDLMIGVDSGPLHVAALTSIKTLGVFRSLKPPRVCLPSPQAVYLVDGKDHDHWTSRPNWNFAEYSGPEPTAADIVMCATKLLGSPSVTQISRGSRMPKKLPSIPGRYTYDRVGYDQREVELLADGTIGEGAGDCEKVWSIEPTPIGEVVTIYGIHGGPTCHLSLNDDGVFRGRWLAYEKMPIELRPIVSAVAPIAFRRNDGLEAHPTKEPKQSVGHPSDSIPDANPAFFFGVLTYNRFDLLELAIEAVLKSTVLPAKIYVVDNSGGKWTGHPSRRIEIIRAPYNLGVSGGFNVLQHLCQPAPLIVGADDVEVGPDLFEKMLECKTPLVFADGSMAYTVHMIRSEAWKAIGPWDAEFYPAYHEDNDYAMRAKLAAMAAGCPLSSGFKNNGPSATKAAMSPEEQGALNNWFSKGRERYVNKWGGTPHCETFSKPFNGAK
ncbi:MAG: hypothetical protein JWP89_3605 [Schlesneria sp.]|nr:hypothetical protein [Schlesneria sp.]